MGPIDDSVEDYCDLVLSVCGIGANVAFRPKLSLHSEESKHHKQ